MTNTKASPNNDNHGTEPESDYRPARKGGVRRCPCGAQAMLGDSTCYSCAA